MRVVDTNTLTNEAGNFEAPVGTFTRGSQVYLAGAVTREQILSVGKIDETGDLNIQLSQIAADKINSGMFGLDTAKGLVATDQHGKRNLFTNRSKNRKTSTGQSYWKRFVWWNNL